MQVQENSAPSRSVLLKSSSGSDAALQINVYILTELGDCLGTNSRTGFFHPIGVRLQSQQPLLTRDGGRWTPLWVRLRSGLLASAFGSR